MLHSVDLNCKSGIIYQEVNYLHKESWRGHLLSTTCTYVMQLHMSTFVSTHVLLFATFRYFDTVSHMLNNCPSDKQDASNKHWSRQCAPSLFRRGSEPSWDFTNITDDDLGGACEGPVSTASQWNQSAICVIDTAGASKVTKMIKPQLYGAGTAENTTERLKCRTP